MNTFKPKLLRRGDTIAVLSPASYPTNTVRFARGLSALESCGYSVRQIPQQSAPVGYLSDTDIVRATVFNEAIQDSSVDAIFCSRGGYGCQRLLDLIDYNAAATNPKLLVGYSDITALQLALYARSGWASLSGPMVAVDWPDIDDWTRDQFLHLAEGRFDGSFSGPDDTGLVAVTDGTGEGVLIGGNLASLVRLIGTPYLPDLRGCILFFEDIGEAPYRIDAMLAQLQATGIFDSLSGLVIGDLGICERSDGKPTLSVAELISDYFNGASFPVATGLSYGHIPVKHTIPIGIRARLTVGKDCSELIMLESVVV